MTIDGYSPDPRLQYDHILNEARPIRLPIGAMLVQRHPELVAWLPGPFGIKRPPRLTLAAE